MPFVVDVVPGARGCTITLASNPLRTLTVDVLSVDFGPEATVTEHPVELGAEVSDHIQVKAERFTVEAFVTNSPLAPSTAVFSPVQTAIDFLKSCLGELLTVTISSEGVFTNMALEGFSHRRTTQEGRGFSLRFKQIRIASALSVTIPPSVPAAVAAAGAPTEGLLGQQGTTVGTPVSALKDIKDVATSVGPAAFLRQLLDW